MSCKCNNKSYLYFSHYWIVCVCAPTSDARPYRLYKGGGSITRSNLVIVSPSFWAVLVYYKIKDSFKMNKSIINNTSPLHSNCMTKECVTVEKLCRKPLGGPWITDCPDLYNKGEYQIPPTPWGHVIVAMIPVVTWEHSVSHSFCWICHSTTRVRSLVLTEW